MNNLLRELLPSLIQGQQNFLSPEQEAELNTLQLWFLSGASLLLVILVLWQILATNRRGHLEATLRQEREEANKALDTAREQARLQAETLLKEADLKAKEALMAAREAGTREQEQARAELRKQADRLNQREEALEQKLGRLQERLTELDQRTDAFKEGEQRLQRER
ncbi:MAG: Rnase Y domain-containing protein, partial [Oligosphaeraceae bacterium]